MSNQPNKFSHYFFYLFWVGVIIALFDNGFNFLGVVTTIGLFIFARGDNQ